MATPMWAYAEAAQRYGSVDPTDSDGVNRFYTDTFPLLPREKQSAILEFLLKREGKSSTR